MQGRCWGGRGVLTGSVPTPNLSGASCAPTLCRAALALPRRGGRGGLSRLRAPVLPSDMILLMAIGNGFAALAARICSFLAALLSLRTDGHADGTRGDVSPRSVQAPRPAGLLRAQPLESRPGTRFGWGRPLC